MDFNESEIVKSLINGDKKAYNYLFDKYYKSLCNYSKSLNRESLSSEDIVQNVFFRLWKKRKKLTHDLNIKNYLYRSVYNEFIDQYRKETSLSLLEKKYLAGVTSFYETIDEPDTQRLYVILKKEIDNLPPKCKETFLLNKMEGLTYIEISEYQHVSVNTVEKQMVKALKTLRKKLSSEFKSYLFILFGLKKSRII